MAEEIKTERAPRRRRSSARPTGESVPPPTEAAPEVKPPNRPTATLQRKLEQFLVSLGLPFAAAGDMHCAMIFAQRGPVVAEAWASLAAESPAVKKVLESMLRGGAWAGALGSTAALVIAVGSHHGLPVPDISNVLLGGEKEQAPTEAEEENAVVFHMPPASNSDTPTAPGPAAVSLPPNGNNGTDLTDPSQYPGPHNSTTA